jgi:hypothetical protein
MTGLAKHFVFRPLGVAIAIAIPLLVCAWHGLALLGRPAHLNQIVAELGSTMRFVNDPLPNHADTRLLYLETTEHGYGVFFCEAPGKRKLLFEQPQTGGGYGRLEETLLGWSPDDNFFAYERRRGGQWEIVIGDGNTGTEAAAVPFNREVAGGAWLSPQTLAFVDSERVFYTMRQSRDQWPRPLLFKYFRDSSHKLPKDPVRGFTAFGPNSVVWQQGAALWSCADDGTAPVKVWESAPNEALLGFAFSQTGRKVLLHCRDARGQYFARFYPGQPADQVKVLARFDPAEYLPSRLAFLNDGEGYAFLTQTGATPDTLVVKPDESHPPMQFPWQDQVKAMTAGSHAVYVTSSLNDEPTGIWKYDPASGLAECVVPNVPKRFSYAQKSHIARETMTNAAGETLTYYLLSPAHLTARQKHPLVVGILGNVEMGFTWSANHEAIANTGAYFVCVDRHRREFSQWANDALAVYEAVARRPGVDTNRLYLYADSAGVASVYDLLEQKPGLWQGAILFSPTYFPDPARIPRTRLFLDNGAADSSFGKEGPEVPMRFQDNAARAGIPVTLLIHPGLGHTFRLPAGERERMREALIFMGRR